MRAMVSRNAASTMSSLSQLSSLSAKATSKSTWEYPLTPSSSKRRRVATISTSFIWFLDEHTFKASVPQFLGRKPSDVSIDSVEDILQYVFAIVSQVLDGELVTPEPLLHFARELLEIQSSKSSDYRCVTNLAVSL